MIPKQRLLLSNWFAEFAKSHPLEICDVGAREELFKPYNALPQSLFQIHGFEPDADEANRLGELYKNKGRKYYPYGLWKESTNIQLSYAELAGNSSIHPPNLEDLERLFPPKHWTNRRPKSILDLPVKSLDDVQKEHPFDVDLLKVDTQGSEYEIMLGAEQLLKNKALFVLLETWTFEVHKGQALTGKIMEWMHEHGFTLVRTNNAADWHRKEITAINRMGLRTLVGLDLLFVRNDFHFPSEEETYRKCVKGAALAELYGFPDLAIQIIDQHAEAMGAFQSKAKEARRIIVENWSRSHEGFLFRSIRKIVSMLGYSLEKHHSDPYAPLH